MSDTYQHLYDAAVYRVRLIRSRLVITHRYWDDGHRRETMVNSMPLPSDRHAFAVAISTLPREAQITAKAWWQANRVRRAKPSPPTATASSRLAQSGPHQGHALPVGIPLAVQMTPTEQRTALDQFIGLVRMSTQGVLEPGLDASLRSALGAAHRALNGGSDDDDDDADDDGHPIVIASDRPQDHTEGLHESDLPSLSSVA